MRHANHMALALTSALMLAGPGMASQPASAPAGIQSSPANYRSGAIAAHRAWWQAFIVADTKYLEARSAPALSLTLSAGQTFDRAAMLAEAATHIHGKELDLSYDVESVRFPVPSMAIVTSRSTELMRTTNYYRNLTVLQRFGKDWRVVAAQSTRELSLAPAVSAAVAGTLSDYPGTYRGPKGRELRVELRGATLMMIESDGKEFVLTPIGPGLFELGQISLGNGLVRLMFARDGTGKVTTMSRVLQTGILVLERVP